jgi:hypothetical protein
MEREALAERSEGSIRMRTIIVALLVVGLAAPAAAGDLASSIANAANAAAQQPEERAPQKGYSKPLVWGGSALFVGGMALGLFAFIDNQNGSYAEFGEANAVNKKLGAAGLITAFAGGTMIFLGSHRGAKRSPSITVGAGQVKVSKQVSW